MIRGLSCSRSRGEATSTAAGEGRAVAGAEALRGAEWSVPLVIATDAVCRNAPNGVTQPIAGSEGVLPAPVQHAARPHADTARTEVRPRELGHERRRGARRIGHRLTGALEPHRHEPA